MLPSLFGKCQCTVGIPINKYAVPLFNYYTSLYDTMTVVLEYSVFLQTQLRVAFCLNSENTTEGAGFCILVWPKNNLFALLEMH